MKSTNPLHQKETEWQGGVYFFEGIALSPDDPIVKSRLRKARPADSPAAHPPKNAAARSGKNNSGFASKERRMSNRVCLFSTNFVPGDYVDRGRRRLVATFASVLCALCLVPCGVHAQDKPAKRGVVKLTDEALKIHREAILIDGHNDLPWQFRTRKDFSFRNFDIARPQPLLAHRHCPAQKRGRRGPVLGGLCAVE